MFCPFWLLLVTFSLINGAPCFPIPRLQQNSIDGTVALGFKQSSNILKKYFPERPTASTPPQDKTVRGDDAIDHIKDVLDHPVTSAKMEPLLRPADSGKRTLSLAQEFPKQLQLSASA